MKLEIYLFPLLLGVVALAAVYIVQQGYPLATSRGSNADRGTGICGAEFHPIALAFCETEKFSIQPRIRSSNE